MVEESQHKSHTNLFPLAQLGVVLSAGILLSNTELPLPLVAGGALLNTLSCLLFLILNRTRLATVFLLCAFLFCGGTLALLELRPVHTNRVKRLLEERVIAPGQPLEVTGVLQRNVEVSWDALYLTLNVERIKAHGFERDVSGVVSLRAPNDSAQLRKLQLRYGARVRVFTKLERTNNFRNPGVSLFTEYLDRKGYDGRASIKSLRLIERLDDDTVFLPLAWAYDWRNKLQQQIDARLSKETAGVLDAAVLGNRHNLSPSAEERFRSGGTFHVLVISGLHITFIGGVVFVVIRKLTRRRLLQFVVCATVVWGYSVGVGGEPSIVRAALMFSVVMLAPLVSRRASPLNGLGAVAIVLLVWKPSSLFDPSFQLTFVSVLAILVVAWPLLNALSSIGSWQPSRVTPYPPSCPSWLRRFAEALYWNERAAVRRVGNANYQYSWFKSRTASRLQGIYLQPVLRFVFAAVVVSISVQIMLLPFLIIYFHRFSTASLLLNIFVGTVIALVAGVALTGLVVAQVSTTLSEPWFRVADALNWLMVHSVDPFSTLGLASFRLPEYTGWLVFLYVLYYLPLGALSFWLMKWKPLGVPKTAGGLKFNRKSFGVTVVLQVVAIAILIVHPYSAEHSDGKLRVDFLDVGQGDAALITLPDNTTMLVDGGGRPGPFGHPTGEAAEHDSTRSIGELVVSEYLWWRGRDRVDYVVATHADADHIDGLNDIARNFNVRAALVARHPEGDGEFSKLLQSLTRNNISLHLIGAGDELRAGGATLRVLWPKPSANTRVPSANNDSLVLHVLYGSRSILLTGDIEAAAERMLVTQQPGFSADITKVPHHGSRTSSTERFVRWTRSKLAVVSVGETSVFGHPHAEVVDRWKANGAQILRTGNRGMISLETDGKSMHYTTFVNP